MDTETAHPEDIAELRDIFGDEDESWALGWDAVRAFEAEHGVVLPEPFRTFIAEVCGSAPDGPPDYGLLAPGKLPVGWDGSPADRDLAAPFPLTEQWLWEVEDRGLGEKELEAALRPIFDHGSVVLGTDGCGMYWHLIVSGEHRGHIWMISGEGATPFGAEFGYTTAEPGFLGWARHWHAGKAWFDEL